MSKPLNFYSCSETRESRSITAFGGHMVAVEGPYVFPIEVLTHRLMHKFYVLDSTTPFVTGFDLLFAAHLIIDAVGRTVYTRSSSTNSYMSASLDPISPPATDVAVITSSDPGDEPSSPPTPVPATLEPSTPPSASDAHEPSDASRHPAVAPLTPCFDEPSFLPTSVLPEVPLSGPDARLRRTGTPSGPVPHHTPGGQLVVYPGLKFQGPPHHASRCFRKIAD